MSVNRVLTGVWAVLALGSVAAAEVVSITSSKDNSLIQNATGDLSNGAGSGLFVGNTHQSGDNIRRAVIAFDIAAAIPQGSTITNVNVTLTCNRARGGAITVGLFPMLANWGEGTSDSGQFGGSGTDSRTNDATWIHAFYAFPGGTLWQNEGGDFNPVANATKSVSGTAAYSWNSNASMVALVQQWLDAPTQNFGWMIKSLNENGSQNAKRFATKEERVVSARPRLTIEYTIPGPGAITAFGVAVIFGRGRRSRG